MKAKKLTRAMLRRKNRRFYSVYFCVLAVVLAAVIFGAFYLKAEMQDFEDTQSIYAARRFFEEMVTEWDYEALYSLETDNRGATQEEYAQAWQTMVGDGKPELVSGGGDGSFIIALDGKKLADFTLKPSETEHSPHGYAYWEMQSVHLTKIPTHTFRVQAREEYTVYCDGVALTSDDRVESGISTGMQANLPDGVQEPKECVYEVSRVSGDPVFTCTDAQGREVPLNNDGSGLLKADVLYGTLDADTTKWVTMTAKCLALYTVDDQDFDELSKYMAKNSPVYAATQAMQTGWSASHTERRFENVAVEKVQFIGDSALCCDVSMDFTILTVKPKEYKTFPMHYTFFFQRLQGKWMLYDMISR